MDLSSWFARFPPSPPPFSPFLGDGDGDTERGRFFRDMYVRIGSRKRVWGVEGGGGEGGGRERRELGGKGGKKGGEGKGERGIWGGEG